MQIPQIIYISLVAMAIGMDLIQNGKPKTGNHSLVTTLIANAIHAAILYWGGFFG